MAGEMAGENVYLHLPRYPLIAQLFMIYYGLPQFGIELDPIPAAMIGLSLNTAAYAAETLRAAIASIDKGSGKRRPVSV